MKFSICIPNYNYGQYIGETIQSVLDQDYHDFEILISDNKSTDNSWEVIEGFAAKDKQIKAWQNPANLGFAGNLDAVTSKAFGDCQLLVSSDDLMNQGALDFYGRFIQSLGNKSFAFTATCIKIDTDSKPIGQDNIKSSLWKNEDLEPYLSQKFGCNIYKVPAGEMLKRCLLNFYGPFNFVATCYSTVDYKKVGGYGGSRMYNPDKWFHWKLLSQVEYAYYIDLPLFSYRWHDNNQAALQKQTGALKFYIDEYRSSFEVDDFMLKKAGLSRSEVQNSFIYNTIHKNTFSFIKQGQITMARRIFHLGWATYPSLMWRSGYAWLLAPLLLFGRLGTLLVRPFKNNYSTTES